MGRVVQLALGPQAQLDHQGQVVLVVQPVQGLQERPDRVDQVDRLEQGLRVQLDLVGLVAHQVCLLPGHRGHLGLVDQVVLLGQV